MRVPFIAWIALGGSWALPAFAVPGGITSSSSGASPAAIVAAAGNMTLMQQQATLNALGAVAANGSVPMTGPQQIGTSTTPLTLSTAPSQSGLNINMVSPGTPGTPGPATAHHGYSATCMKQGFFGPNTGTGSPQVGEMDCLNLVARQDGYNPSNTANGGDAGDISLILGDVGSTLRAQNFTNLLEAHVSVVNTASNTLPYYMDMQEGSISEIGHPNDDGTQSEMQAWFAALIDGHGSGLKIVEQADTSPQAGKLGHGVIDNIIEAARYTGQDTYRVDGNGLTTALTWQLGTDAGNVNLTLGSPGNPFGNFATATPYIDFDGMGASSNVRIISDGAAQLSIETVGTRNYVFNGSYALFSQPLTVPQIEIDQKVYLDSQHTMWVQESGGKVVIGNGSTRLFSIDPNGNVVAKGTITANGTP